jgi:hypothetical protein
MAISISTYTLPVGFSRADVLTKLETVFADLGFHGPGITGLATSLKSFTGGGTVASAAYAYYSGMSASATSGSGKGASVDITRNSLGAISQVTLNCPGQDYRDNDTITISAADIGGAGAGAQDLVITLNASTTTYGSPTTYFTKDYNRNDPWAVMRMEMDETKKYGFTYRGLRIDTSNRLILSVGSSFNPTTTDSYGNLGWGLGVSYRGVKFLDCLADPNDSRNRIYDGLAQAYTGVCWSTNSFPLDIIVYRSALDPNFAVISFYQPNLSSTNLIENTFATFTLNKYSSNLWDLDYVFQGGLNVFFPVVNGPGYNVGIRSDWVSLGYGTASQPMNRLAEFGFGRCQTGSYGTSFSDSYFSNTFTNDQESNDIRVYIRDTAYDNPSSLNSNQEIDPKTDYRAVIKGIPVSSKVAPIPYYFPDEFVIIDFVLNQPSQNIQPGDTVTVSATEVYTVITGGYVTNKTSSTWGVLLAARTT